MTNIYINVYPCITLRVVVLLFRIVAEFPLIKMDLAITYNV